MCTMARFSSWTITWAAFCVLSVCSAALHGQAVGKHVALGVASDWTHRHVLYPSSNNYAVMARICLATAGGSAGCVLSLDITSGFPTVNAGSIALAAPGGTTGIVVDNDSSLSQASNIYYATKSGAALVKATQLGLN